MQNIPYDKIVEISTTSFRHFNLANCKWLLNRYCNYSCSYCWPNLTLIKNKECKLTKNDKNSDNYWSRKINW